MSSKRTPEEVEQLKQNWKNDPIWDIEDTEGFEAHREELADFRMMCELEWGALEIIREEALDAEADKLGVRGLYRLYLEQQKKIERLVRAIGAHSEGENLHAYRIMQGYEE